MKNIGLPKGVVRTPDGHLRYTSPKALRGKYVHRKIVEDLLDETPWSVKLLLPWPYEVHHQDYNKENNDPGNLLLVSEALHAAMTAHRARQYNGKFRPKWAPPPEWTLFKESIDEVPF